MFERKIMKAIFILQLQIMKPKRQVKPEQRSFYGFTRINKLNEDTSETNPIYHLLTPIANAKVDTITSKFVSVFGNQILIKTGQAIEKPIVSPLFKFHVFHIVLTDYISYDFKATTYKVSLLNDLTMYMNDPKDKHLVEAIKEAASQIFVQVFQSKGTKKLTELRETLLKREQRLKLYKEILDEEGKKYAEEYLEIKNKVSKKNRETLTEERVLLSENYARTQIEVVKLIEPLRFHQQLQKLKSFCDTHKDFFGTELRADNRYKPIRYSIKINCPSLAAEPVLIRLDDFMALREQNVDYRREYLVMARDILSELNRYRMETSAKAKDKEGTACGSYYQFLSPESVIVDQLTLRAKLSYQLPVRNALGLRNKPCSTECRLAFFCTPKEFDYYQCQKELEAKTKLILSDAHFGCEKMYNKLNNPNKDKVYISEQKRQLEGLRQQMCVERFLLLCHKMFYNQEFGKLKDIRTSYQRIQQHFQQSLKDAKEQIRQNPQKLSIFIDPSAHKKSLNSFDFKFDQLLEFLQPDDIDSAVEAVKHQKVKIFLSVKSAIAEKIINILKDEYFFSRISNAKKYIILFFVAGIQYLEELSACLALDPKAYQQIPQLISEVRQSDSEKKQEKRKLKVEVTIKNTFSKIEEYRMRDKNQKEGKLGYLVDDQFGKKLYEFVVRLNNKIEDHKSIQKNIADLIQAQKKAESYSELLRGTVKEALRMVDSDLLLFKQVLLEFFYPQIELRYRDTPQRLPVFQEKETARFALEYYKQVSRRFGLILKAFLTCRSDNYVVYDTILGKMLRFSQQQPKYDEASTITEQAIKKERSVLFSIDDMLAYTSSAPRAYKHLVSEANKRVIEAGESYRIDDESVFLSSKFKNPSTFLKKEEGREEEEFEKEE